MATRRVTVEVKVMLTIEAEESVEISKVIDEMDYTFSDTTNEAPITNTEIIDYEVKDSR